VIYAVEFDSTEKSQVTRIHSLIFK